jgi:Reverse transcriptase (RNA-dependent DNA polymerase)
MSSHLLLHPVFDIAEASTGVADGKVVHPTAHNRIDELDYPIYRLRDEASENVLEFTQQCGTLLKLGRIIRPPLALQASHAAEFKTQEAEAFSLCQVNLPTLCLVDIDLEFGQFLAQRLRRVEIPKRGGQGVRVLSIPTIRDRVVQGALKLILEPIFEADFQAGSYGYRPKRSAHAAVARVAQAIVRRMGR